MISKIQSKEYEISADARKCVKSYYYCLSTDIKPFEDVSNGDILYFMDWNTLSDAEKEAAVSQIWMYDAQNKRWLPQ